MNPLMRAIHFLGLACFLVVRFSTEAQQPTARLLPDDATAAWAEVSKVHQALRPPDDWRNRQPSAEEIATFQKQVSQTAVAYADKAREFVARFPTNENVSDARVTVVHALSHAVAAGDANAEKQIQDFVATVLGDQSLKEDDRVAVLLFSGNTRFMKQVGMRLFTEGMAKLHTEFESSSIESTRAALQQFPTNSMLHTMMVAMAQRAKGDQQKELATEILNAPGAPPGAKTLADHLLKGTRPYAIGRPVDIKFAALDGREVDLAKLKGQVVLIDFWATTCGPCVAGLPELKDVYEKFHDRGFEVVAISLDDHESALRRFIQEKELPWPQHFDGKGWENIFAVRYGVFSIPTMWLIDRRGNLRSADVRGALEKRIQSLISEPAP